jgi:hypothetical protein
MAKLSGAEKTVHSELKDLLDLKNNGAINEEEFDRLKKDMLSKTLPKPVRTGNGWQEVLAVLFGILGGIFYAVGTKQSAKKKTVVFSIAFVWNMFISSLPTTNSPSSPPIVSTPQSVQTSQNKAKATSSAIPKLITSGEFEFSNATADPYNYDGNADVAGRLIKVSFDVKNTSNKSKPPAYGVSYALKDNQGREFEEAAITIGIMDDSIKKRVTDNILPGSSQRVSLIFDVSKDAQTFQLGIANGFSGKEWLKVDG